MESLFELQSLYFNSAYLGPLPRRAFEKIQAMASKTFDPGMQDHNSWFDISDRVRAAFAGILGAAPHNVAVSTSVSELVSHVANGLHLSEDDEVLLMTGEYPSMVLPWLVLSERHGFKLRFLDIEDFCEPDRFRRALAPNTKYAAVSHVRFNTGERFPITELAKVCRAAQVLFLCDVSQSFGGMALPFGALENVDILVGVAYKWLLGPYGSAFGYFSDSALRLLQRTHASWLNSKGAKTRENLLNYSSESLPGARRFDRGQASNFIASAGLEGALEIISEIGLDKIESHNRALVEIFLEELPAALDVVGGRRFSSNIVCVKSQKSDPAELQAKLAANNIAATVREGNLRLSFHLFNTPAQVRTLIRALT